jgi:hypothetical protein
MTRLLSMVAIVVLLAGVVIGARFQPSGDDQRRAAIAAMRMINTAEHAIKNRDGKFVHLAELLAHPAMGRVKADFAVNGGVVMYHGSTVRLAVSTDGAQYQVSVLPGETCGWAAFSDERGLIYTGKVLDC